MKDRQRWAGSKWTAVEPQHREKHFVALQYMPGPKAVELEAVYTRRRYVVAVKQLKDGGRWRRGWR